MIGKKLEACWWNTCVWVYVLYPLTLLFCFLSFLRRMVYTRTRVKSEPLAVPVIVVGNITVGGTGKTPFVIWLVEYLKQQGYQPGIVARGYGGKASHWPQQVTADSDPRLLGDEPVLLVRRLAVPMSVAPDRYQAAQQLLAQTDCDVIVSDDGLQHYALPRDIEIVMIDGQRRFGNGLCLPAGPLRERVSRLKRADLLISTGKAQAGEYAMTLVLDKIYHLNPPRIMQSISDFSKVHAVAGMGHPERFFEFLRGQGLTVIAHPMPDHSVFTLDDLSFNDELPVLMTEKDAVKCESFATKQHWVVCVKAQLSDRVCTIVTQQLNGLNNG